MLSVDTWWVIAVSLSAVCCAARNTTFPSGWVICWLCTWPEALTLRCENWMLRRAMLAPKGAAAPGIQKRDGSAGHQFCDRRVGGGGPADQVAVHIARDVGIPPDEFRHAVDAERAGDKAPCPAGLYRSPAM